MEQDPPTAAELGISELEYERILRGLKQRERPEPGADASSHEPGGEPRTERISHRPFWVSLTLIGTLLLVVTLVSGGSDKPAYAFLHMANGHAVTYSSCKPVPVAIYPAGGPPDAEALVREAVSALRGITGLDIVVTGVFGGHAPNWGFQAAPISPDDPISVSWQDGKAIDELTDDVAGLGGSFVIPGLNGNEHLASGTIALSRDYYAGLTERHDHAEALAVLLHEFGHVLGLDHVHSSGELMYDDNIGRTTFGPGDLEGLRLLGQGPCV